MAWFSSVQEALSARGMSAFPTRDRPADRWAGAPGEPEREPSDADLLSQFWLSERFVNASQALTRWGHLRLLDADGRAVGDISGPRPDAFHQLTDLMRSRPDLSVWVPVGPQTCVAALLQDEAELLEAAKEGPPAKPEPGDPALPAYLRPINEARATALQIVPDLPPIREKLVAPGSGKSLSEVGKEFLTPAPRRQIRWFAWRWPPGWDFPHGRTGAGLRVVSSVPAEGTPLTVDGVRYQTSWSFSALGHELLPMPGWLCRVLGKETR
jgi:hypothetical protein